MLFSGTSTESSKSGVSSNLSNWCSFGELMSVAEVRLQEGESVENALRRFKRKVQAEDIIKEMKRHSFFLKPGDKRRVKQALARKRARKKIRKDIGSRLSRNNSSRCCQAFKANTTWSCKQILRRKCQNTIPPPNATDARSRESE